MLEFVIYILAAFGFAYIVGLSRISFPIRHVLVRIGEWAWYTRPFLWLVDLIQCPMCLGFWTGLIAAWRFDASLLGLNLISSAFIAGCVTAATNALLLSVVHNALLEGQ